MKHHNDPSWPVAPEDYGTIVFPMTEDEAIEALMEMVEDDHA